MQPNLLHTYFTTFSINNHISVFKDFPETNLIIIESFNHLVNNSKMTIYSFIIMRNHVHIVWESNPDLSIDETITSFKKFTGRRISLYLEQINPNYHDLLKSKRIDRKFKIWNIHNGNIRIYNHKMLLIKIKYIHNNPIKGDYKSVNSIEDYYFSSALAYSIQSSNFSFLTVLDNIVPWY